MRLDPIGRGRILPKQTKGPKAYIQSKALKVWLQGSLLLGVWPTFSNVAGSPERSQEKGI